MSKVATKKNAKKSAVAKVETRDGITKVQVRVLTALRKAANGLTGNGVAEKADIHPTMVGASVGYRNEEINARPVHCNNLVNKGFVKIVKDPEAGYVYTITAAGRKALEAALKA